MRGRAPLTSHQQERQYPASSFQSIGTVLPILQGPHEALQAIPVAMVFLPETLPDLSLFQLLPPWQHHLFSGAF